MMPPAIAPPAYTFDGIGLPEKYFVKVNNSIGLFIRRNFANKFFLISWGFLQKN